MIKYVFNNEPTSEYFGLKLTDHIWNLLRFYDLTAISFNKKNYNI